MAATPGSEDEFVDVRDPQRNRRERPRMSDITRAVDKAEQGQVVLNLPNWEDTIKSYEEEDPFYDQVANNLKDANNAKSMLTGTLPYLAVGADKNTPESLKTLRWEIYDLLDRYDADYGKTIKFLLMQEVERLFKEYTHS